MLAAGLESTINVELLGPGEDPLAVVTDEHQLQLLLGLRVQVIIEVQERLVACCSGKLLREVFVDLLQRGHYRPGS